jgi:gluconolactonase
MTDDVVVRRDGTVWFTDPSYALTRRRLFAVIDPGYPDGVKVDADGRVYAACCRGVQVFAPDGAVVGEIAVPGAVNLAFAGADRIFVTADTAVWTAATPEPRKEH